MKKLKAICAMLVILVALSGCGAYKEHTTKMNALVGEWVLDSMYIDTKSVDTPEATMTINDDFTGIYNEKIKQTQTDEEGNVTFVTKENQKGEKEFVMVDDPKSITIKEVSDGVFSLTKDGTTTEYRFNIDEAAGNLHMWVEIESKEYHYIFIDKEVY